MNEQNIIISESITSDAVMFWAVGLSHVQSLKTNIHIYGRNIISRRLLRPPPLQRSCSLILIYVTYVVVISLASAA